MLQRSMSTETLAFPTDLSDHALISEVKELARAERQAMARLIASLAELDARHLYLREACASLFVYCTQVLHLSEHAAYGRIEAARAARRFPLTLDLLADGSINLTGVCLLAPHLTPDNHRAVLDAARHKTKREVEHMVAALRPRPDVQSAVRKLPRRTTKPAPPVEVPTTAAVIPSQDALLEDVPSVRATESPKRPPIVRPLAPERYQVQFTVSPEIYEKLRQVQDLLRHTIPNGDPAAIFDRALTLLLAELQKGRQAATDRPRAARPATSGSRHVPAAVKREVWARDGGQCAFVGTNGRCTERGFLELHHVVPFADGGATTVANLQLRCRAHNAYEAERWFGAEQDLLRETGATYGALVHNDRCGVQLGPGPSCSDETSFCGFRLPPEGGSHRSTMRAEL
jgi:5-methylcytosine-specific restriction endonuclease McrA